MIQSNLIKSIILIWHKGINHLHLGDQSNTSLAKGKDKGMNEDGEPPLPLPPRLLPAR